MSAEPIDLFLARIKQESPAVYEVMVEMVTTLQELAARGETVTLPAIGVLGLLEVAFTAGLIHARRREVYVSSVTP